MTQNHDADVLRSWHANAVAWTAAIEADAIESRVAATNAAIVEAVMRHAPASVLDVGCGEGWLVRELAARGLESTGIDAVPALVERARAQGGGEFHVVSYEDLIAGDYRPERTFGAVVCNFSLLGERIVEDLLQALTNLVTDGGRLFVQTVHPRAQADSTGQAAADGWREESWQGFGGAFERPAPWYFRTRESWLALLEATGWRTLEIEEPRRRGGTGGESLLFVCAAA